MSNAPEAGQAKALCICCPALGLHSKPSPTFPTCTSRSRALVLLTELKPGGSFLIFLSSLVILS